MGFMRRKDREVQDRAGVRSILDRCTVCHIAMQDEQGLYIVPVNFGYVWEEDQLVLYFHSAKEGRKVLALASCPSVAFEMDCDHELVPAQQPCAYSYHYSSVMGSGTAQMVEEPDEKARALSCIMEHQSGKVFAFDEEMAGAVAVYQIQVKALSAKQNL